MFRSRKPTPTIGDGDDDGFSAAKLKVPDRGAKARSELLSGRPGRDDRNARPVNGEHDPDSDNPYREAELQELQDLADTKGKEVTSSVYRAVKIAEDTRNIAAQTLYTLETQGEQIKETQGKALKVEKELKKGEKLLNKLGPMFTPSWKIKKGQKLKGPSEFRDESEFGSAGLDGSREKLGLDGKKKSAVDSSNLSTWEQEKLKQDEGLDQISIALEQMKNIAIGMGAEMDKQEKDVDALTDNVIELKNRVAQANKRGRNLLNRR